MYSIATPDFSRVISYLRIAHTVQVGVLEAVFVRVDAALERKVRFNGPLLKPLIAF
jgi:hypothetical protein